MKEKNEKEQNEKKITDISIYVASLSSIYSPAKAPADTTHWFSTDEILNAIRELNPGAEISKEHIFEAMRDAGYDFANRPCAQGLAFKWMLKEK